MKEPCFIAQVKKHFDYLVNEYGFAITSESYAQDSFGNASVQFQSTDVTLVIILDRSQVLIDIGPYPEISGYQFGLSTIVEFLLPDVKEPVYIFPERWEDLCEMIQVQIIRLADLLRKDCLAVLQGGFLKWQELYEFERRQGISKYQAITGKPPVQVNTKRAWSIIQNKIHDRQKKE